MSASLAPIKNWKPWHEKIVLMHLANKSNKKIAKRLDITPQRVSQVLQDPQAKKIIRGFINGLRSRMTDEIEDKLLLMAEKSVNNLHDTLAAEFKAGSKPKKHQDRTSLEILKGTGFLTKERVGGEDQKTAISEEVMQKFSDALEKVAEAREYRDQEVLEAEVVSDEDAA